MCASVSPSFWHFLISHNTHHIPLNKCPAPNVIMTFLPRKIIIRNCCLSSNMAISAILNSKLDLNLGCFIFNYHFSIWWSGNCCLGSNMAKCRASTLSSQYTTFRWLLFYHLRSQFLVRSVASQAVAHCMLNFFVICVEKWSLQK